MFEIEIKKGECFEFGKNWQSFLFHVYKPILKGLISFVPGTGFLFLQRSQNSDSARYCYSVWLRHLVQANQHGLLASPPDVVAELGLGDSLGTGIAALISGCGEYRAFDAVRYASPEVNLQVFDELVPLFQQQADIPDETEFPKTGPRLESYAFPAEILTPDRLKAALEPSRLEKIRNAIASLATQGEQSELIS